MNELHILANTTQNRSLTEFLPCDITSKTASNEHRTSPLDYNHPISDSCSEEQLSHIDLQSKIHLELIEQANKSTGYLKLITGGTCAASKSYENFLSVTTSADQESINSSEEPSSPASTSDSRNSSNLQRSQALKRLNLSQASSYYCGKALPRAYTKNSILCLNKERVIHSGLPLRDSSRPFTSCIPGGVQIGLIYPNSPALFNQRASIPWKTTFDFACSVNSSDSAKIPMQAGASTVPCVLKGSEFANSVKVNQQNPIQMQEYHHMSSFGINNHNQSSFTMADRDAYESEIQRLRQRVIELESELQNTKNQLCTRDRDIDKLRSVLVQKVSTDEPMSISMDVLDEEEEQTSMDFAGSFVHPGDKIRNGTQLSMKNVNQNVGLSALTVQAQTQPIRIKKQGVSGDSITHESDLEHHLKDPSSKVLIRDALLNNDFLKHLDDMQINEMVECMYEKRIKQGCFVIREGEVGDALYVTAEGSLQVLKESRVLGNMEVGRAFGELALLYNCLRTASVRALTDSRFWTLDRKVYRQIMFSSTVNRLEENKRFLRSIPEFRCLPDQKMNKLAEVLEESVYASNQYIIREGDLGQDFFIIKSGNTLVTQSNVNGKEREIRRLGPGDWFGEKALYRLEKRSANVIALSPGVTLLSLDRNNFIYLIGDLNEIKSKEYGDGRGSTSSEVSIVEKIQTPGSLQSVGDRIEAESSMMGSMTSVDGVMMGLSSPRMVPPFVENTSFLMGQKPQPLNVRLEDLHAIAILGIGGFGKVELVQWKLDMTRSFALKCMKKQHIVETKQEKHILSERNLMFEIDSPHVCKLYATYRDNKFVYMLLEVCLGGELWTILRNRGNFDDNITRFVVGCVLEAFTYLHTRGILYRDLKPENLLLDASGYIKLCDFGFAKKVGIGRKTWTFCGTPEYVAPEIILSKGHDHSADYWSLGILMYELLTGCPPFTGSDPMKTYNVILRGIDAVEFPPNFIGRTANALIKRLCAQNPVERLGYGRGGIIDIKQHRYFMGFDWIGLHRGTMKPPIIPNIKGPDDCSNFDKYSEQPNEPSDELSGWDLEF